MIWLIVASVYIAALGWAYWLSQHSAVEAPLLLPPTLAIVIAPGILSLVMFWIGLARIPIQFATIYALYLLLMAPGWYLAWRHGITWPARPQLSPLQAWALLLMVGISSAILFNAAYFPFHRPDALGIYELYANRIADRRTLVPITRQFQLYQLYPQLMSMTYAFVYQAAEWHNPYPARLMTALLNLTGLSATFLLARQVHSTTAAWIAVLLLALTPDFGTWASAGYVDLPMAAYYTLCAVFTWAALHHGRTTDVALAALMIGLAAWVKNAALLGCLLFFTILLWGLIRRKLALKQVLLASGLVAIVALPWYARNLILSGQLIPDTVWADDAQQTLSEIFVLVTRPQNYGLPGVVMLISVWWGGWQLLRTQHSGVFFVLWWSVPYYVLWLFFASYDPRFILLFLPFLSILGAMLCATLWQQAGNRRQPILAVMMVLVTVLAVQVMWGSVEFKRDILQNPLMSHEEKLDIVNRE